VRTAIKFYFLASANDGVFLPGHMNLIRDNGIVCESIILGSMSKENAGGLWSWMC